MSQRGRSTELVPAEPFVRWLKDQMARLEKDQTIRLHENYPRPPIVDALARRLGVHPRALYRYLRGWKSDGEPTDTFQLRRVGAMLEHAGVALWEVYPEAAEITLEPDVWCYRCQEMVTPIDGKCPWHVPAKQLKRNAVILADYWLTDEQLHTLWAIHRRWKIPILSLAEQSYQRLRYQSAAHCERAIRNGFDRLGFSRPRVATKRRGAA